MRNWIIKYRLYHIPFWIAYHLLWMLINVGSFNAMLFYLFQNDVPVKFIGYIIFQAAGAYFNLYYLIPGFLYPGRYKTYIFLVAITVLVCSALITLGYYLNAWTSDKTFTELFGKRPDQFLLIFSIMVLPSTAGAMTLAMSVKLGKNWLSVEKKRLVLEKENLETELKYLKAQINPHFLFNTINSIFVLIHKNPDLASESLASFSEMLRYQLYECNEKEIPLNKELKFLENFIELESLRLHEDQTDLSFEINHSTVHNSYIAPFILLPFVENSFKHLSKGRTRQHFIKMNLSVTDQRVLELNIENSRNTEADGIPTLSGIGLANVQRRLNLVYPGKHELCIGGEPTEFKVVLKIDLA
jgi:two-component system, LytTR family, sensor kinase